jgi:hypothetical protein
MDRNRALLMAVLALIPVPIAMYNQIQQLAVLQLLPDAESLRGLSSIQLEWQATLYLETFDDGVTIAQVFWGLWLFPLAYLSIQSKAVPMVIAGLLMIAGAGHVIDPLCGIVVPGYGLQISLFTSLGEFVFLFWLLIKGVKEPLREAGPAAS